MDVPGEKLLIKLWDSIADKGIGSLLKPWQMRREGRTAIDMRREELLVLAQAEVDAEAIRSGQKFLLPDGTVSEQQSAPVLLPSSPTQPLLLPSIDQVAQQNARIEAIRREISLAKVVVFAEQELVHDTQEPPEEKVSDDWLHRWREHAAGVSSDELQSLWGKILAGEIKKPGRYSPRTLEFLKNLSQDEAKAIERLSPFVINDIIFRDDETLLESQGVPFSLLFSMQELGVVSGVEALGLEVVWPSIANDHFERALVSYGRVLLVKHADPARQLKLQIYQVTSLGRQILRLGNFQPNETYLRALGTSIKSQGFDVAIGDCRPAGDNRITLLNMQPL
ncbi:DUF2806 domain-containing protein [Aromatoleum petrolei]|uniref:DUF2806 domain-containing protein n=1 Tax=Aromatoleum petrolei TaxID=76116 RepID=A0ABX1MWQ4_9RHOO|nr:DUF2806 domain-containing protein [Aromatoleum petrolei]NMF90988.1 DUF2806 domain-containing protein [Aromatoleum petrolei]QTQ36747.1 putative protein DUF2806 [Aromatoleum petrolei]